MPSKKKKYNARFPAARIKKIMQSDEEVGKVAQAVPIIISRTLELFVESLLLKTLKITNSRSAKTLSTSHMKQCIMNEQRFDFLRELVKNIPDISVAEEAANYCDNDEDNIGGGGGGQSSPDEHYMDSDTPYDLSLPSTSAKCQNLRAANGSGVNDTNAMIVGHVHLEEYNQRQHLKRHSYSNTNNGSNSSNSSSSNSAGMMVNANLRHTNSLNSMQGGDCVPSKIKRAESMPLPLASNQPINLQQHQQRHQQLLHVQQHKHHHQRSKTHHPFSTSETAVTSTTADDDDVDVDDDGDDDEDDVDGDDDNDTSSNNNIDRNTLLEQPINIAVAATPANNININTAAPRLPTVLPPPIVNIDFRNKPFVKIDYSSLSPTSSNTTTSSTPVINIDLSNIVPTNLDDSVMPQIELVTKTAVAAAIASTTATLTTTNTNTTAAATTTCTFRTSSLSSSLPIATNTQSTPNTSAVAFSSDVRKRLDYQASNITPTTINTNTSTTLSSVHGVGVGVSTMALANRRVIDFDLDEDYDNL